MASFTLDPVKTALVVIDLTKGVLSLPSVPHPVQQVLANTVRLADAFRSTGSFVVLVNVNSIDGKDMLHPITDTGFLLPAQRPKDWAELTPELGPHPLDHLITKHQWGAFFGTDLDLQLRRRKIETIVLCGIATGFGVDTTAREGLSTWLPAGVCRRWNERLVARRASLRLHAYLSTHWASAL